MFRILASCSLALALTANALARAGDVSPGQIDSAHSRVTFTVTKWGFEEVQGRFRDFSGDISYDAAAPERSHIDWHVKIATVSTGEERRDRNLQTPDFFDANRYPEMRFVSERVRQVAPSELDVAGTLTIKGVAKPLTVRVRCLGRHGVESGGAIEAFATTFTINRYDFAVTGGTVMGTIISKEVVITLLAAVRVGS